jgi:DNA repair protein RadC
MEDMRYYDREHFKCLYLNRKNQVISLETISIGGLANALVHPREVFKPAVKRSAAAVILIHNHPSGDPTPSKEDINITKRLIESGKLLGIEVLDHIIIGDGRYFSLKAGNVI